MEIIVCIKAVCMNPVRFVLSESGDSIDCGNKTLVMNEADEYALEQALAMKTELGASVTVISIGGLPTQDTLYVAKAKGADRVIKVDADNTNPLSVSEALTGVIGGLKFDIILTGIESFDSMTGQTGIYLAEKLGLPFAYAVSEIDATPGSDTVRVKKELGGGVYQVLDIKLPAVFCIQSGIQPLKYTPPAKVLRARRELLESYSSQDITPAAAGATPTAQPRLVSVFKPERISKVELLEGDLSKVASAVVDKILEVT